MKTDAELHVDWHGPFIGEIWIVTPDGDRWQIPADHVRGFTRDAQSGALPRFDLHFFGRVVEHREDAA